MAEEDINANPNVDEEDEEDNEAQAEEAQRILDDLNQFNDGSETPDEVEDQPDNLGDEDEENVGNTNSQSMSSIHTGSIQTEAQINAGLPPAGEVAFERADISALQEDPNAEPAPIQPAADQPQYDQRQAEPELQGAGGPANFNNDAPPAPEEAAPVEEAAAPSEEGGTGAGGEEIVAAAQPTAPAAAVAAAPTTASAPTQASTVTEATEATEATVATEPTVVTDATQPTDATDATDATDTTDATEPSQPTDQADAPDLSTGSVTGAEDTAIALDVSASLTDLDGSESLSMTISGFPAGSALSHGTDNGDGTWTISAEEFAANPDLLSNLTVTPPTDYFGDFDLTVTATATESVGGDYEDVVSTFGVTVSPVLDNPFLETGNITGDEDTSVELQIAAFMDSSTTESVDTLILSGIPEGAFLNKGTNNGDGTWTLSAGELSGIIMTPPQDFEGTIGVQVTAISTDGGVAVSSFDIEVEGVIDVENATGVEDQSIALNIDPGNATEITITGVPDGAELSAGTYNGNGSYTLTVADLNGLTITPAPNSDDDFTLNVNGEELFVEVDASADAPTLDLGDGLASGAEDGGPIALDISAALTDTDGSESLSITISGVPDGAKLSAGIDNGDGTWTLSGGDLDNLTITPADDFGGTIDLQVTVTSTESEGGATATTSGSISIDVAAVADAADVSIEAATGTEDSAISLDISAVSTDADGSESVSVEIGNIPDGATLTYVDADGATQSNDVSGNSATLTPEQLNGLSITPPENSDADFQLSVDVTTTDGDDSLTVPYTLDVSVAADADAPTLVVGETASGAEDAAISLDIGASLTDVDGSESLSITISGVPDGAMLSAGTDNNDGTWTISADDLADDPTLLDNLTITPPEDFSGTIDLGVTATATEQDGGASAVTTGAISVDVAAVADDADVTVTAASGNEETAIALDISAVSTDADGSETVSIEVGNIPEGATLSYVDADGATQSIDVSGSSVTLSPEQLSGLSITPPENSDGDFQLSVGVTATENDGDTATTSSSISVTMPETDNGADGAVITENDASGFEDTAIALDIDVDMSDTDGSETLSITISDIPSGAVLHDGNGNEISITDGSAELTAGQLEGLTITPPENSNVDFDLTVTATTTETSTGETASSEVTLSVDVTGVADAPELSVDLGEPTASGGAPSPVAYWNMDETSGTTLNDQVGNNDGHSYELGSGSGSGHGSGSGAQMKALDLDDRTDIDGSGSGAGQHDEVTAELNTAVEFKDSDRQFIEVDHSAALKPASGTMTMWFNADDDRNGTLASSDSRGYDSGGHFNLSINSSGQLELRMQDENSSHTISGGDVDKGEWNQVTVSWGEGGMKIYQNGELVASDPSYTGGLQGNENPWTFGASQAYSGNNTSDGVNDFFDGHIDDIAIYDVPMTDAQAQDLCEMGVEDFADSGGDAVLTYPVEIGGGLVDTDGSESLSYSISDLPDGAQLLVNGEVVTADENGAYSVSDDDIGNVEISVPGDTGDFAFTVSATATEDDGSSRTVTTIGGIDDSSSDGSFDQLSDSGEVWDNNEYSTSVEAISGGDGNDTVWTGDGDDTIAGGGGDDRLHGEYGDDTLYGGDGDDTLVGGDGDDVLVGGAGDDVAYGGQGDDLFIFGAGDGADHFDGGNGWSDTIQLDGVDGGPGGEGGWTLELDDGRSFTAGEDGIDFGGEVAGKIELADGSELTFEGVEKLEW